MRNKRDISTTRVDIMKGLGRFQMLAVAAAVLAIPLVGATPAYAHCDTMDGPVVLAAQRALTTGELAPLLIWVRDQDEAEIRHAFEHTLQVRALGESAAELADRYFFETVVRIHREGEGEPYTGLKPAGTDLGEMVPAADRALASDSAAELRQLLTATLDTRLDEYFAEALKRRAFAPNDVAAGRAYVEAYVHLLHFVEEFEALTSSHGHGHGTAQVSGAAPHGH